MAIEWIGLQVKRVVFHEVFARSDKGTPQPPSYGSNIIPIDAKTRSVIESRMRSALGGGSHGVQMRIDQHGPNTFFQIAAGLVDTTNPVFCKESRKIVDSLNRVQASRELPGGVVVIVQGTIGNNKNDFIAVIKAEPDDGLTLGEKDGQQVVNYLSNILLTKTQRFYKIGFLVDVEQDSSEELDPANYEAYIFDEKLNNETLTGAAQYFYRNFLGLEQIDTAKTTTRDFFTLTKKFIRKANLDPEEKIDLNNSLVVLLKVNQSKTISVNDFAKSHLPADLRDSYNEYMTAEGMPTNSFHKDIELLKNVLRRRKLTFPGDVVIVAPAESIGKGKAVWIDDQLTTAKETVVRIKGKVTGEK